MKFTTSTEINPSSHKISYLSRVMLIGSCFAKEIGARFKKGRMPAFVNPFGVLYNPESVAASLQITLERKEFVISDLSTYNGKYLSFFHDTSFSGSKSESVLENVNESIRQSNEFIMNTDFLFITFGTAWVYKWNETGDIVSNCHKIPANKFTRFLLTPEEIFRRWVPLIDTVHKIIPGIKIVFTVSPVRHLKDGTHGNQLSKSVLHLAIKKLMEHDNRLTYFPSYELVLDDLRDYRFYDDDMVHPSGKAIDYIWERLADCYFSRESNELYSKISAIHLAREHRLMSQDQEDIKQFRLSLLKKISDIKKEYPFVNLDDDKRYFDSL